MRSELQELYIQIEKLLLIFRCNSNIQEKQIQSQGCLYLEIFSSGKFDLLKRYLRSWATDHEEKAENEFALYKLA